MSNYDAVVLLHQEKLCHPHHVLFPAEIPNGQFHLYQLQLLPGSISYLLQFFSLAQMHHEIIKYN
jgi:hypothetical protein